MNSLEVREARPEDAQAISALAIRSKAHWGYSETFMEACKDELTVTPKKILSGEFHISVAEKNSVLVGYYTLESIDPNTIEMDALFIDPDYIGQGLGKALMAHAKQTAINLAGQSLIVQSDPFAEPFYVAMGGTRVGSRSSGSIPGRSLPILVFDLQQKASK